MRRCFQCGKRTDAEQLTSVGDGEFCAACFRLLLDAETEASRPGAQSPPALSPAAASPAAVEKPAAAPRRGAARACLVCERSIHGDAAVSFLGGELCAACNGQMQRELREAEGAVEPAVSRAAAAPENDTSESDASRAALAAARAAVTERAPPSAGTAGAGPARGQPTAIFTPGAETRWCAGCERPMPGPGSYRIIAGEPYCPACVPFYSVLNLGAFPRRPSPQPAPEAAATAQAASAGCDCCGAALERGAEPCEGFRLCTACFTSDVELALAVARARHRRKLEALRAAIDTGKTS